ncbi:DNA repair protein RecN, partial [Pseudomonadota bacterium]
YAIIDSIDLEFTAGFTCVTGETGAGKSILVDALGLLCGKRADTSAVRDGADKAELAAEFTLTPDSPALAWLQNAELEDDDRCLLRRVITESGRSRAWINGSPVTLSQLAELGESLVEIHGQNEHILLVRQDEQFRLLDSEGSCDAALQKVGHAFKTWSKLENQKLQILSEEALDAGDRELLQYQIRELEESMLTADQFLAIEAEHRLLARGGELAEALNQALALLDQDPSGAEPALHRAAIQLSPYADLDNGIGGAVELLNSAAIHCTEAISSIESARSRLDSSPERLTELERQLGNQHDLARKHRVEPDGLEDVLEQIRQRFELADSLDSRLTELEEKLALALKDYRQCAKTLSSQRGTRAKKLANDVTSLMQELGMEGGAFQIRVHYDEKRQPSARGGDELELLVSANPGIQPGLLRKVASGGELSRISLAIKVASKSGNRATTQIFDEVDAGIGGDTANAVGALLKSLSAGTQALCVTHLAQVAVFADRQLQVQKQSDDRETRVRTRLLQDEQRVDEIARMLGGRLSEQSRAHASELLAAASVRH